MEKVTVCMPTKNREGILSIELASLFQFKDIIEEVVVLNVGDSFISEELKQMIGIYEQEGIKISFYAEKRQLLEARKFLWGKVKTDILWMMDDDMFVVSGVYECIKLLNKYDVVGFMVPNAEKIRERTEKFVDKLHLCNSKEFIKSREGNAMVGGIYFARRDIPVCFENDLAADDPREDRVLFKNVENIVLYTGAVAYHMTSEKIGSNFDYEKYFGEKNLMWRD